MTLHPDAILLVVTPFDLETGMADDDPDPNHVPALKHGFTRAQFFIILKQSRAFVVAQKLRFRSMASYLPLYLSYGDKADFLRPPFTRAWQDRLQRFDAIATKLSDRAHAAGVPFVIAFVPQEAELALMTQRPLPPGVDPNALPQALAEIAARHGARFVDTSDELRTRPEPQRLYYQVDGHLSGNGQPLAAKSIANLFGAETETFTACRDTRSSASEATQ
jgi:hypothetical protein